MNNPTSVHGERVPCQQHLHGPVLDELLQLRSTTGVNHHRPRDDAHFAATLDAARNLPCEFVSGMLHPPLARHTGAMPSSRLLVEQHDHALSAAAGQQELAHIHIMRVIPHATTPTVAAP